MNLKEGIKVVRRQADAGRTAFSVGEDFWRGPAGWVLVLAMLTVGLVAQAYAYWSYDDTLSDRFGLTEQVEDEPGVVNGDGLLPADVPRSTINGQQLVDDIQPLFAVMVDNLYVARPQASVADASLVWEAPVEGGITRLLVLLRSDEDLRRVGPVRSVRPYFIDWAREYGAVLVHVGGSPQALQELQTGGWPELDEMSRGGYFWRDRKRSAPHNAYTSSELLAAALEDGVIGEVETEPVGFRPFRESGTDTSERDEVMEVRLSYGTSGADVTWNFDEGSGLYLRHQGSGRFVDESGDQIMADNIIVQLTDISVIDSVGRRSVRTTGHGQAWVFMDGTVREVTWVKEEGGRTRFVDPDSEDEIALNIGTTWVQVIGEAGQLEY